MTGTTWADRVPTRRRTQSGNAVVEHHAMQETMPDAGIHGPEPTAVASVAAGTAATLGAAGYVFGTTGWLPTFVTVALAGWVLVCTAVLTAEVVSGVRRKLGRS